MCTYICEVTIIFPFVIYVFIFPRDKWSAARSKFKRLIFGSNHSETVIYPRESRRRCSEVKKQPTITSEQKCIKTNKDYI